MVRGLREGRGGKVNDGGCIVGVEKIKCRGVLRR